MDPTYAVAQEFPKIIFNIVSGYKNRPKYGDLLWPH
jgi:hypothetical protein